MSDYDTDTSDTYEDRIEQLGEEIQQLQAENKQLKLDLDFRDMLLEQIIKVVEGAAQALKEAQ